MPNSPRGTVNIYDDTSPVGALIRIFSGSGWTHCSMSLGDGQAIQCDMNAGGWAIENEGQAMRTESYLYPGDIEAVLTTLTKRKGCKYDFVTILANPWWNIFKKAPPVSANAYNCATFLWTAFAADQAFAKRTALAFKPASAVTPQDIRDVLRGLR